MLITTTNEWELYDKSGLVSVGSHSLFVSTRGPPRKPEAPVVIFITGGGAPTECYVHLHHAISKFARNYFYDRAGYGRSERLDPVAKTESHGQNCARTTGVNIDDRGEHAWWAPGGSTVGRDASPIDSNSLRSSMNGYSVKHSRNITAEDSASELHQLMRVLRVRPPYVLAAHSYGGIIARTYYGLYPDDVAGIALLETNSELLQQTLGPMPPLAYQRVTADVDVDKLTHLREKSGMTDEEWGAAVAAVRRTRSTTSHEATHQSGRELAHRMQIDQQAMGDKPLVVLTSEMEVEWRLILDEGLRLGGGTRNERREAQWWMETAEMFCPQVLRVQLGMSKNAEFVHFKDVGHAFPMIVPEKTAAVIKELLLRVAL